MKQRIVDQASTVPQTERKKYKRTTQSIFRTTPTNPVHLQQVYQRHGMIGMGGNTQSTSSTETYRRLINEIGFKTDMPSWAQRMNIDTVAERSMKATVLVRRKTNKEIEENTFLSKNQRTETKGQRYFKMQIPIRAGQSFNKFVKDFDKQLSRGPDNPRKVGSEDYIGQDGPENYEILSIYNYNYPDADIQLEDDYIQPEDEYADYPGLENEDFMTDQYLDPLERIRRYQYWKLNLLDDLIEGVDDDIRYQFTDVLQDFVKDNQQWIAQMEVGQKYQPSRFFDTLQQPQRQVRNVMFDVGKAMKYGSNLRFGHHKFVKSKLEDEFSLRPLRLRDTNCIYESLMIIKYYYDHQMLPRCNDISWQTLVLLQFNNETIEFQDVVVNGCLQEIIELFQDTYNIVVGYFNCHQHEKELEMIKEQEDNQIEVPEFFLCYHNHHVFPVKKTQLKNISQRVSSNFLRVLGIKEDQSERQFCVIPPIFKLLEVDYYDCIYNNKTFEQTLIQQNGYDLADVISFSMFSGQKLLSFTDIRQAFNMYCNISYRSRDQKFINDLNYFHNIIDDNGREYSKQMNQQTFQQSQQKFIVGNGTSMHLLQQEIIRREKHFDEIGLAAVDIETCFDTSGNHSMYNMRPFMLHIYGRLQKIQSTADSSQIVMQDIDECFVGFDCMEMFMQYMKFNNYVWSDVVLDKLNIPKEKANNINNYLWAHNGFGFDWLYLFEPLTKDLDGFKLIGDTSQTKCFMGNGLRLYDFKYIYAEKLDSLAKQFFPQNKDLHKLQCADIIDMLPEIAEEIMKDGKHVKEDGQVILLDDIKKYCRQDTIVLYEMVKIFFKNLYTTPKGHYFVRQPFYHSASAIAWEVLTNCFLKVPLLINRATQNIEQRMKFGGLTQEYRTRCGFGIIIDVNSEYPSVMMNLMPVRYKYLDEQAIQTWAGDQIITGRNLVANGIQRHNIYMIQFKFSDACRFPTICVKTQKTLIQPRQSVNFMNGVEEYQPVFGDSIITAIQCDPECQIHISKYIDFVPDYIFRDYVQYFYTKRLDAQSQGDKINDKFYKLMLNTAFGKFIQKQYEQCMMGSKEEVIDYMEELNQSKMVQQMKLEQLLTEEVPLYQVKYKMKYDHYQHRGTMVRIGSLITEYARNHLMRMKHCIAKEFGWQSICYSDTDSIVISFDHCDDFTNTVIQGIYEDYKACKALGLDTSKAERQLVSYLTNNECVKRMRQLQINDLCNLHQNIDVPMLDEKRLGASKIEKFIINGEFLAPKQYLLNYYAEGQFKQSIKIKGIQQRFMSEEIFMKMVEKKREVPFVPVEYLIDEETGEKIVLDDNNQQAFEDMYKQFEQEFGGNDIAHVQVEKWQRFMTGVIKTPIIKILTANHKKRFFEDQFSVPFQTASDQIDNDYHVTVHNNDKKEYLKQMILDAYAKLRQDGSYQLASNATKLKTSLKRKTFFGFEYEKSILEESKKRFMIHLPKIRYDHIQDVVLRLILNDPHFNIDATNYVPKLVSICQQAMYLKKTQAKKSSGDFRITSQDSGKVIAYCLYIYNYLQRHGVAIPENFQRICDELCKVVKKFVVDGFEEPARSQWRHACDWGLHFLSCPIPIINYDRLTKETKPENYQNVEPLQNNIRFVTLWQRLNKYEQLIVKLPLEEIAKDEKLIQYFNNSFNKDLLKFDLISESNDNKEQMSLIVNEKDISKESPNMTEDGICFHAKQNNRIQQIVYDESQMQDLEMDFAVKQLEYKQQVNQQFMMLDHNVEIHVDLVGEYLTQHVFKDDEITNDELIYKIFTDGNTKFTKNKKDVSDVVDYCLLIQFLFFGGMDAVAAIKTVVEKRSKFIRQDYTHYQLVQVFRIIFQRVNMFKNMQNRRNAPQKFVKFLQSIDKFIQNNYPNINAYKFDLMHDVVALNLPYELVSIMNRILYIDERSIKIGNEMTQRLLRWIQPSEQMQQRLYGILLMHGTSHMHDNQEYQQFMIQNAIQNNNLSITDQKVYDYFMGEDKDILGKQFNTLVEKEYIEMQQEHGWQQAMGNSQPSNKDTEKLVGLKRRRLTRIEDDEEIKVGEKVDIFERESNESECHSLMGMIRQLDESDRKKEDQIYLDIVRHRSQRVELEDSFDMDQIIARQDYEQQQQLKRLKKSGFFDLEAEESDDEYY